MARKRDRCPRCGSPRIAPVIFGSPEEVRDVWLEGRAFPLPPEERIPGWPHLGCLECGQTWAPSRLHLHTLEPCR